jgi:hypothetical protein
MSAFTTSPSYRETLRRHRLLLSVPVILGALVAAWFVLGAPKSYVSTASLWADTSAPNASSVGNVDPALTPPSTLEQAVLTELLTTKSFAVSVANHSTLGRYLATHGTSGFSPTALLGGGGPLVARIEAAVSSKKVTTTVPGPQILQIRYSGPNAGVAQSTLAAIVRELRTASTTFGRSYDRNLESYYQGQVTAATEALDSATSALSTYQSQHPGSTANGPSVSALTAAVTNARTQLTAASQSLNAAAGAGTADAGGLSVQTVDPASAPLGATSGKKKDLEGILGGLLAGALISFLGVIALTRSELDPWEDERAATTNGRTRSTAAVAATNGKPAARPRKRTSPAHADVPPVEESLPAPVEVP